MTKAAAQAPAKQALQEHSATKAAGAALLYFCTALALTVLNKAIFSSYGFSLVRVLGLAQLVAAVLLLHLLASLGLVTVPHVSAASLRACLPLSAAALGAQLSVFAALGSTNLVMFGTLRRTNIIFTLAAQRLFLGRNASRPVVAACLLVCGGAIMAGATDLTFDAYGYGMAMLANTFTAAHLVLIKKSPVQMDSLSLVYHNALLGSPALALYCLAAGDFERLAAFEFIGDPSFQAVFAVSVSLGFCINFATMLNTRVNSPLTQVVTGQTKGAFVLLAGVMVFSSNTGISASSLCGALVGFAGAALYAAARYRENQRSRAEAAATNAKADAEEALNRKQADVEMQAPRRTASAEPRASGQPTFPSPHRPLSAAPDLSSSPASAPAPGAGGGGNRAAVLAPRPRAAVEPRRLACPRPGKRLAAAAAAAAAAGPPSPSEPVPVLARSMTPDHAVERVAGPAVVSVQVVG